ncbi:uncharacterized protein MYCFIDRAFT_207116 [Pseudocercospora fijiensis CIRAD86]|uniref:Uncharacterized protein n=1 Tax=Pseudocercospora fijiensis (strain CIRAD86) TaxID=383855 RepID=M3AHB6_PSEFD|nr:uncharacterized protein MYCFIDRAFT_207116 [Pseudocercospora fijiensis CIRAD86]EME83971.1 hypothetical protein MYCFIDRAFT_207116 [Pseudocercospora fijiensis CIRAD86]
MDRSLWTLSHKLCLDWLASNSIDLTCSCPKEPHTGRAVSPAYINGHSATYDTEQNTIFLTNSRPTATMDPDVARMLADLGNSRRDEISAPDEGDPDQSYRNRREEREILLRAEDHRANAHLHAKNPDEAAALEAWNTPSTFGTDDVAEQMENRYSGQGHRARLEQKRSQRFGYEANEGYHSSQRSRQDYAQVSRNMRSSFPEYQSLTNLQDEANRRAHHQAYQARANAPGPSRQRAASPRSFGKDKFIRDQRLPQQSGVLAAASSIPTGGFAFAPSTSASSASSVTAVTGVQARPVAPVPQGHKPPTAPQAPAPAARTRAVGTSTASQTVSGPRTSALAAAATSPPMPPPAKAKSITREGMLGSIYKHLMKNKDAYFPKPAVQEKTGEDDQKAVERREALTETSMIAIPLPAQLPVDEWMSSGKDMQRSKKMQALNDAATKEDQASYWQKPNEIHLLHTAREKIAEDVALLAQPEHSEQADDYYKKQRYREWLRAYGAQARVGSVGNTDIPVIAEIVKATNNLLSKGIAAAALRSPAVKTGSTTARPPTPPSTVSNSRSSSIGAQEPTELSSPPQPETATGSLGATFCNKDGVCMGTRQRPADAPVNAKITFPGTYDVLGMAEGADSLAESPRRKARRCVAEGRDSSFSYRFDERRGGFGIYLARMSPRNEGLAGTFVSISISISISISMSVRAFLCSAPRLMISLHLLRRTIPRGRSTGERFECQWRIQDKVRTRVLENHVLGSFLEARRNRAASYFFSFSSSNDPDVRGYVSRILEQLDEDQFDGAWHGGHAASEDSVEEPEGEEVHKLGKDYISFLESGLLDLTYDISSFLLPKVRGFLASKEKRSLTTPSTSLLLHALHYAQASACGHVFIAIDPGPVIGPEAEAEAEAEGVVRGLCDIFKIMCTCFAPACSNAMFPIYVSCMPGQGCIRGDLVGILGGRESSWKLKGSGTRSACIECLRGKKERKKDALAAEKRESSMQHFLPQRYSTIFAPTNCF